MTLINKALGTVMSISIKLISKSNLQEAGCINYEEIIDTISNAFKDYQNGFIMLPDKISQVFNAEVQNRINCMPATLMKEGICGVKWVSVFPENPCKLGIPNVSGMIVLSELETGYPIAVMDGTIITSIRTACVGAIGAKYLAKKNSTIYGTIGTGEEAKMHFRLLKYVLPTIKTCYVSSKTGKSEQSFVDILKHEYPDVKFIKCHGNNRMASFDADVIVTAVSCQNPLLKADSIKDGAFYCHVGGWEDEFEVALKANKIVCDNWEALKHRGSPTLAKLFEQGLLTDEAIYANLGELICDMKPGRESDKEFIYFNSIGLGFVDVAVAYSFYKKAIRSNQYSIWEM